jgi:hypothetical protein
MPGGEFDRKHGQMPIATASERERGRGVASAISADDGRPQHVVVEREPMARVYGGREGRRRAEAELPPLPRSRARVERSGTRE